MTEKMNFSPEVEKKEVPDTSEKSKDFTSLSQNLKDIRRQELDDILKEIGYKNMDPNTKLEYRIINLEEPEDIAEINVNTETIGYDNLSYDEKMKYRVKILQEIPKLAELQIKFDNLDYELTIEEKQTREKLIAEHDDTQYKIFQKRNEELITR